MNMIVFEEPSVMFLNVIVFPSGGKAESLSTIAR